MKKIITNLLLSKPYYGYLATKIRLNESEDVKTIKVTFQQGIVVSYNKSWLNGYKEHQKEGILVHELLHLALLHFYRREGRQKMLWDVSCDIAISELMDDEDIIDSRITRTNAAKELGITLEQNKNAEYYYNKLEEVKDSFSLLSMPGSVKIVFEDGANYDIEDLEELNESDLESKSVINELFKIQNYALSEQLLDNGMLNSLDDIYKDYQIKWRTVLKRFLSGRGKIQTRKSYKRVSRRFENNPGTKRSIGLNVLIAIDESSSISDNQIQAFYKELIRIDKFTSDNILVVSFDSKCSNPIPLHQFLVNQKRERFGGTDFRPVFKLADDSKIRNIILFTDGDGKAPLTVEQKVLWVLTNNGTKPQDYGISVRFQEEV